MTRVTWSKCCSLPEAKGIDLAQLSKNVGRLGLMAPPWQLQPRFSAQQGLTQGSCLPLQQLETSEALRL